MINQSMNSVIGFVFFFMLNNFLFAFIFMVIGIKIKPDGFDDYDYLGVPSIFTYFIESIRNSLGDLAIPEYENTWYADGEGDSDSNFMLAVTWLTWLLATFFNLLFLLNFIIALINSAYESVMNSYEKHNNIQMNEFNKNF